MLKPAATSASTGSTRPAAPSLDQEAATSVTEFTRAFKAAARAVTLYPSTHPAIKSALDRLVDAARKVTVSGPLTLSVLPDSLLIDDMAIDRPDSSISEVAVQLHSHKIGSLTIRPGTTSSTWPKLLHLLARTPEDVAAAGGIRRLWQSPDSNRVEIKEIDYSQALRGRASRAAAWEDIVAHCLKGDPADGVENASLFVEVASDTTRMRELFSMFESRAATTDPTGRGTALHQMLREIVGAISANGADQLDAALDTVSGAVTTLSAETLWSLLEADKECRRDESLDLVQTLRARLPDDSIAAFVGTSVTREHGASARLAEAFQTLVPQSDDRHRLIHLAHDQVAESEFGKQGGFDALWQNVTDMLTSYSDQPFVPDEYNVELTRARGQPIDVDQVPDDPPDRVSSWLATVSDTAVRALDLELLVDILSVETDPERWSSIALPVVSQIEDLFLIGDLAAAARLVDALTQGAARHSADSRVSVARQAIDRLAAGPMTRHAADHLRTANDQQFELVRRTCHAVGSPIVVPLVGALAAETLERSRQRLMEVLRGFGSEDLGAVEPLLHSPDPALRRAAILLLRDTRGGKVLADLESMLEDSDPQVQREAIRAIVTLRTDEAYAVLEKAMTSGAGRAQHAVLHALGSIRDEQAVPLFSYIVSHVDHRGPLHQIYVRAVESLGTLGGEHSVDVLKEALYRGEWYAPLRTSALRQAVASALGKIGTPRALKVLEEAAGCGPRGVRAAARSQLGHHRS